MKLQTELKISGAHSIPDHLGKCRRLHGHTWRIVVTLEGTINKRTGMLIDFSVIKNIIDELDHTTINKYVVNPTAENICMFLLNKIKDRVHNNIGSVTVRVYESDESFVEETKLTII